MVPLIGALRKKKSYGTILFRDLPHGMLTANSPPAIFNRYFQLTIQECTS